jgi:hypothetical protein
MAAMDAPTIGALAVVDWADVTDALAAAVQGMCMRGVGGRA